MRFFMLCRRACECTQDSTSAHTHAPTPASCPSEGKSALNRTVWAPAICMTIKARFDDEDYCLPACHDSFETTKVQRPSSKVLSTDSSRAYWMWTWTGFSFLQITRLKMTSLFKGKSRRRRRELAFLVRVVKYWNDLPASALTEQGKTGSFLTFLHKTTID